MVKVLFLFLIISLNSCFAQNEITQAIFFDTDKYELSATEKVNLNRFIQSLDTATIKAFSIHAYCDEKGEENYNLKLSEKRATTIRSQLVQLGLNPNKIIEFIGKGEIQLVKKSAETIEEERALNRRVDLTIQLKSVISKSKTENKLLSDSIEIGYKFTLENILFIGGRHELLPESFPALESLVHVLKLRPDMHIYILGHVCCVFDGQDAFDDQSGYFNLSTERAKAVYAYLVKNGIESNRLKFKGLKGNFSTGRGEKFDKRVEIEITRI